jgi:hypothetical protein
MSFRGRTPAPRRAEARSAHAGPVARAGCRTAAARGRGCGAGAGGRALGAVVPPTADRHGSSLPPSAKPCWPAIGREGSAIGMRLWVHHPLCLRRVAGQSKVVIGLDTARLQGRLSFVPGSLPALDPLTGAGRCRSGTKREWRVERRTAARGRGLRRWRLWWALDALVPPTAGRRGSPTGTLTLPSRRTLALSPSAAVHGARMLTVATELACYAPSSSRSAASSARSSATSRSRRAMRSSSAAPAGTAVPTVMPA